MACYEKSTAIQHDACNGFVCLCVCHNALSNSERFILRKYVSQVGAIDELLRDSENHE